MKARLAWFAYRRHGTVTIGSALGFESATRFRFRQRQPDHGHQSFIMLHDAFETRAQAVSSARVYLLRYAQLAEEALTEARANLAQFERDERVNGTG